MKKFHLTLISLLFITLGASAQRSTIKKFEDQTIKGLIVSGAFDVNIVEGGSSGVEVTLADDMADKLLMEVTEDGYLRLSFGSSASNLFLKSEDRPKAKFSAKSLEYISLSGSSVLLGSGEFKADQLNIVVKESAFLSFVDIKCNDVIVTTEGTSKIEKLTVDAKQTAIFDVRGSSSVTIYGEAQSVDADATSTSALDIVSFSSPLIDAHASGTATIKLNVTGEAKVKKVGLAAIRYIGDGKIIGEGAKRL